MYARAGLYNTTLQVQIIREKQQEKILEWICPNRAGYLKPKCMDSEEVENTCHQFLQSKEYLNWAGNRRPSTFICTGQRMSLATSNSLTLVLKLGPENHISCPLAIYNFADISSVIFHRLRGNPRLGISYFIFNHSNREQSAEDVIRFLLRQVVAQLPSVPADIQTEYYKFKNDPHQVIPNKDKFRSLLRSSLKHIATSSSPLSFVLLDAYDEFRNGPEEEHEREALRSCLSEISHAGLAKILITTRDHCQKELERAFADSQVAEYKGDIRDVERYLDLKLQFPKRKPRLKNLIRNTILEANKKEPWYNSSKVLSHRTGFCLPVCNCIRFSQ